MTVIGDGDVQVTSITENHGTTRPPTESADRKETQQEQQSRQLLAASAETEVEDYYSDSAEQRSNGAGAEGEVRAARDERQPKVRGTCLHRTILRPHGYRVAPAPRHREGSRARRRCRSDGDRHDRSQQQTAAGGQQLAGSSQQTATSSLLIAPRRYRWKEIPHSLRKDRSESATAGGRIQRIQSSSFSPPARSKRKQRERERSGIGSFGKDDDLNLGRWLSVGSFGKDDDLNHGVDLQHRIVRERRWLRDRRIVSDKADKERRSNTHPQQRPGGESTTVGASRKQLSLSDVPWHKVGFKRCEP